MRRAITILFAGLIVAVVLLPFITWGLALTGGWNAAALTFLLAAWSIIIRADSSRAPQLAAREGQTEGSARVLVVGASVASLLGAGYALRLAGQKSGAPRMLLIGAAVLTVVQRVRRHLSAVIAGGLLYPVRDSRVQPLARPKSRYLGNSECADLRLWRLVTRPQGEGAAGR